MAHVLLHLARLDDDGIPVVVLHLGQVAVDVFASL